MAFPDDQSTWQSLEQTKSALLVEAEALKGAGLDAAARPVYMDVARHERQLAAVFRATGREDDAFISELSAASCFMEGHQFESAYGLLSQLAQSAPDNQEVAQLLAACEGKDDEPLVGDPPQVTALVRLLLKKGVIEATEWRSELASVGG